MTSAPHPGVPEVLNTPRLRLRPVRVSDAEAIFASYAQDPQVSRYMTWKPHHSINVTLDFLQRCERAWQEGSAHNWAITRPESDLVLGGIELRMDGHRAEIGYVLMRSEWGKGYMTEAARAVVEMALSLPGVFRVSAVCDVDNAASARVMEKVGMQREGLLRRYIMHPNLSDEPRDVYLYASVR